MPPPPPEQEIVVPPPPPQEEEKKGFGWNLPPTLPNWHDQPPKKEKPHATLFCNRPIYVYDEEEGQKEEVKSPPQCPFHHLVPIRFHQGWAYVKCPHQLCAVFLDEAKSPDILARLQNQKHPQLIAGNGTAADPNLPLTCFCYETFALRVAQTTKNPERLSFTCKSRQCRFFQWANEPWYPRLRDLWAQANKTV